MSKSSYKLDYEEWVTLNGDRQNIKIRSQGEENPVLLFIHGGPGVCDRNWVLHYQSSLARDFTMVMWDQRGSGKSYRKSVKSEKITVEDYIQDAKALVEYLCAKFHKDKIIVQGHSWGTIIGIPLVSRYPEHIAAYIGQGQFIEGEKNEEISYRFCVDAAKKAGDTKRLKKLLAGPPSKGVYPTNDAMMTQRDCLTRYGGAAYKERSGMMKSIIIPLIKMEGYKLTELPAYAKGALYLSDYLWADVVSANFEGITELSMPVLLTLGRHDYNTPFELAEQWFENLNAPYKELCWFEESAHSPIKEEPEKWGEAVTKFCKEHVNEK